MNTITIEITEEEARLLAERSSDHTSAEDVAAHYFRVGLRACHGMDRRTQEDYPVL